MLWFGIKSVKRVSKTVVRVELKDYRDLRGTV